MPNPSRRPPFPGTAAWARTPEEVQRMAATATVAQAGAQSLWPSNSREEIYRRANGQRSMHRAGFDFFNVTPPAYGGGGGGCAGGNGGMLDAVRYLSPSDLLPPPPLESAPKSNPREVISKVCGEAFMAATDKYTRSVTAPLSSRMVEHYPPDELDRIARRELVRMLVADMERNLPITCHNDSWRGMVCAETEVMVIPKEQFREMVRSVEAAIVSQCVANGWIK